MAGENETVPALLGCPFCGGPASVEEVDGAVGLSFSVACDSPSEEDCPAYQVFTTWPRRSEAVAAWNRRAARPDPAEADGWQSIETAPRDGSWFLAYRPAPKYGSCVRLLPTRWHDEYADFISPEDIFDIYDGDVDERRDDGRFRHDFWEIGRSITHWMPLPAPPGQEPGR